jgi:hypothetical protein
MIRKIKLNSDIFLNRKIFLAIFWGRRGAGERGNPVFTTGFPGQSIMAASGFVYRWRQTKRLPQRLQ